LDIVVEAGLFGCKPVSTPIEVVYDLEYDEKDLFTQPDLYRRLIGKLLYLLSTRPDVSFAMNHLSQFVTRPYNQHYEGVLRINKYLKGNPGTGIYLNSESLLSLDGYYDADLGNYLFSRKSITRYIIFLGGSPISWKSKKQTHIATSTVESEFRAIHTLISEVIWLRSLLIDLGIDVQELGNIYCDNLAAQHIATNPTFHERTKHLNISYHFVREKLLEGYIQLHHVPSRIQKVDIMTKPLAKCDFNRLISMLGIMDIHAAEHAREC
jgi:hypothetical protein